MHRLYADENFPLRVVEELRALGHDVLTAFEDGKANLAISDQDVLKRATELQRAVLTINRVDFKRIHRQDPQHEGLILCTEDPDRVGQAKRIDDALGLCDRLISQLIKVYRPSRL